MVFMMGIIALAVVLILIRPLARARSACGTRSADETRDSVSVHVAEYKRRLADLERDVARGTVISTGDAEAARSEIARQLLAHQSAPAAPKVVAKSGRRASLVAIGLVALVPVLAFVVYFAIGNPGYGDRPLAARAGFAGDNGETGTGTAPSDQQVQALLAQLEARLAADPQQPEGWALLARTYESFKRPQAAARAWHGLLAAAPDHPDGLWYAGVHAAQSGDHEGARAHWQKLQGQYNPGTPDYDLLAEALATLK